MMNSNTSNHHAPIKQSKLRGNTKLRINKTLRDEIIKRSRLKNKANKSGKEDKRFYNIQRNKVSGVSLTSWGEGASLALVGNPSSDGITIKIPYGVDVLLHPPASHPIFSYWDG